MEGISIANDTQVRVYIYDLTKGLAKLFSQLPVAEKRINGLWHTSVVIFGHEYFYGNRGINTVKPGGTILGNPLEILKLGTTQIEYTEFEEFICEMGDTKFPSETYHLFEHNCNKFTQELVNYLTGKKLPEYLLILPREVINTPLGDSLRNLLAPVSLKAEIKISKAERMKWKEVKTGRDVPSLKVIGEAIPLTDTTPECTSASCEVVNEDELEEEKNSNSKPNYFELLNEISQVEDTKEDKDYPDLWELKESLLASKRRQTSPLVINNIDDSKYPQLLCFFKRA